MEGFGSTIEGIFSDIGSALAAAFAVDKVSDFVKGAVAAFSEFEQLVGGVDTLFKGSSGKLKENADAAFQTAGMSANDYMDTATSFAASLIQALGGDTEKAVEYVDRAVVAMSDNANKMGTDLDTVVGTYQSLARGNYGMLDNLKLGYGGVKSELERLIADASTYTDVQREMGVTVDASSMSFDNIVNAIAVVQGHLGIAGATAEESATTIEGSVNSMKAAWENWLVGLGNENADLSGLTDNLTGSFETVVHNVAPVVGQIGESLTQVFSDLTGIDVSGIINIFGSIAESVSAIGKGFSEGGVSGGFEAITAQIETLTGLDLSGVVDVFNGVGEAITTIGKGFSEGGVSGGFEAIAGQIEALTGLDLSGVVDVFTGVGEAITTIGKGFSEGGVGGGFEAIVGQIEALTGTDLSGVVDVFTGIGEAITTIGKGFSEGGVSGGLVSVIEQIETLTGLDLSGLKDGISGISEVFSNIAGAFEQGGMLGGFSEIAAMLTELTEIDFTHFVSGVQDVVAIISEKVPEIGAKAQEIFGGIQNVFTVFSEYLTAIWPIISPIITGVIDAMTGFITSAFETLSGIFSNILDAISGAVDVITGVIGAVTAVLKGDFEAAAAAIQTAWDGVLEFFGGIANGILDAFKGIISGMAGIGRDMWEGLKDGFSAAVDGFKGLGEKLTDGFKDVFGIHSPSRVFAEIGGFMAQGLEQGWNSEISTNRLKAPTIQTGRIDVKNSTMGRLSAASINNAVALAAGSDRSQPVPINLIVDGRTLAQVMYDPMNNLIKQKGVPLGV